MPYPLKIAVAIPTFNRLSYLKNAVRSIEDQVFDTEQVELYCVIANSASYDGTTEYLESLESGTARYILHNEVSFTKEEGNAKSGQTNWSRVAAAVPSDVEWVWFMGDDDHLICKNAISKLAQAIHQHQSSSLAVVHVAQARRSRRSGLVLSGKLIDLCNSLGFHEMLGWMSGLIIRGDIFKCFIDVGSMHYAESAYSHSAALLELASSDDALFLDVDWVDTQDDQQTTESIQRWAEANVGERYFYVVDGVLSQFERGILTKKLKPVFYRYHTYSLWDRYACYLIERVLKSGTMTEAESQHWTRVSRIAATIDDPVFVKMFLAWHRAVTLQFQCVIQAQRQLKDQMNALVEYYNQMASVCYDSEELLAAFIPQPKLPRSLMRPTDGWAQEQK